MLRELKSLIFGDSFSDGARFAADNPRDEIERCIQYARDFDEYGDFERGMEYHLKHRARFPDKTLGARGQEPA